MHFVRLYSTMVWFIYLMSASLALNRYQGSQGTAMISYNLQGTQGLGQAMERRAGIQELCSVVAQAHSGCIYMAKLNSNRKLSTAVGWWGLILTLLGHLSHDQHHFAFQTVSGHM